MLNPTPSPGPEPIRLFDDDTPTTVRPSSAPQFAAPADTAPPQCHAGEPTTPLPFLSATTPSPTPSLAPVPITLLTAPVDAIGPGANVTGLSAGHYATGVRVGAAAWATCFGWIGEGELVGGHEFALPAGIGPNTLNVPDLHLCH